MAAYYLDFETDTEDREKPDPTKDKIVTIQYQRFFDDSGRPAQEGLQILKAWESSEKHILKEFLDKTLWLETLSTQDSQGRWNFIPAGVNLKYEFTILSGRTKELLNRNLPTTFLFGLPHYDLQSILVIANRGSFKGASLSNFSQKIGTGKDAAQYIRNKDWNKLIAYIQQETDAFLDLYSFLIEKLPPLFHSYLSG